MVLVNTSIKFSCCTKKECSNASFKNFGAGSYCVKHYRFSYMRKSAKDAGKYVPSFQELDEVLKNLDGMACRGCGKEMLWHSSMGAKADVLSLQHNRDGTLDFICLSCNATHYHFPGDIFYEIPDGSKFCQKCRTVKPKTEFYNSSYMKTGVSTNCIPCEKARCMERNSKMSEQGRHNRRLRHREWLKKNPTKLKMYRAASEKKRREKRKHDPVLV